MNVLKYNAEWLPSARAQPISKPVLGVVGTVSAWIPLVNNLFIAYRIIFFIHKPDIFYCFQSAGWQHGYFRTYKKIRPDVYFKP